MSEQPERPCPWHYVAPHRIRTGGLALPKRKSWGEIEDLNLQRFARILEFQGCIAFVGSGASCDLEYPGWKKLLPRDPLYEELRKELKKEAIEAPAALEIAADLFEAREDGGESNTGGRQFLVGHIEGLFEKAKKKAEGKRSKGELTHEPLPALLDLPLRRFITTNYDEELERALKERHGESGYEDSKSFAQDDTEKLAKFAVALARSNRNMVFHCHGLLPEPRQANSSNHAANRPQGPLQVRTLETSKSARDTLVLTDEDYKYWYLSNEPMVFTFQRCLEVLLQSNPLFFVGYSLSDSDLVRILRHLSVNQVPRKVASSAFALIPLPEALRPRIDGDRDRWDLWCRAQQIKFGINLIPYESSETSLAEELRNRRLEYEGIRRDWRRQPRAKEVSDKRVAVLQPRSNKDLLFENDSLDKDEFLRKIYEAVRRRRVVALLGPAGAGKYVKASQFVRRYANHFEMAVFGSHGNEDLYSYLKRIVEVTSDIVGIKKENPSDQTLVSRLKEVLNRKLEEPRKSLLIVISGLDLFLDFDEDYDAARRDEASPQDNVEPSKGGKGISADECRRARKPSVPLNKVKDDLMNLLKEWSEGEDSGKERASKPLVPRNKLADGLMNLLEERSEGTNSSKDRARKPWVPRNKVADDLMSLLEEWSEGDNTGNRILLTSRSIPEERKREIECIPLRRESEGPHPFPIEQLGLNPEEREESEAYSKLTWHLGEQHYALIIAAAYIVDFEERERPAAGATSPRQARLNELLHILSANSFERGTRVVRHIVRALDELDKEGSGRRHELLLMYLSCFNTPILKSVIDGCIGLPTFEELPEGWLQKAFERLIQFRLLNAIGEQVSNRDKDDVRDERLYVVPDVVKRYCRTILAGSQHPEKRACGVHGLLSRGPFNDPGKPQPGRPQRARQLFEHFAKRAFEEIEITKQRKGEVASALTVRNAQLFTRAALDILRSNFACNSVPQWGSYRDYVDMCSFCLDLVNNLAWATGEDLWSPGEENPKIFNRQGFPTASPEEMIFLYNELGLAYYNEGAIQDALSVWGLAFEWQKAVETMDLEQAEMYSASLYSHLGMAYIQMGRMETARECIEKASAAAGRIGNEDLNVRMGGILARIDHFRGNIEDARRGYEKVARELGRMGNHRAQSYFMRHCASLVIRLKDFEQAEQMVRSSMAIAASENCTDMVAFCRELLAKIYNYMDKPRDAIREYLVTRTQARRLGIARLEADALLGLARVQLGLGDATAARVHATDALKLANENLLVLRQIKALVVIGQAAAQLGDFKVGMSCLEHASTLASDSEFRLAEHDAEEALAELRVGRDRRGSAFKQ